MIKLSEDEKIRYLEKLESLLYDLQKQKRINQINYYLVNYTVIGKDSCSL